MVRGRINCAGALLLFLTGVILYYRNSDLPTAGAPTLIIAGLLWGGLVLDNPLRERRHDLRSRDGALRAAPVLGAGYRRHRVSRRAPARRFAAEAPLRPYGAEGGVAANAPAIVAAGSFVGYSLRIASKEARESLYGARGSTWAVLSAIVLTLISSNLLLTGKEVSPPDRSEMLCNVTNLAVGLGLLVAGLFAADPVVIGKGRTEPEGLLLAPAKRGVLLLGKVLGVMAAWLPIFVISAPYILVVGSGTSASWVALIYTFVLGTLCVAGFAALTVGLGALLRLGRGVTPVFLTLFIAMAAPTLLDTALRKSQLGNAYNALSPFAQANLSLEGVIVDREGVLAQLPHVGALVAFAVMAGALAAFAARGASPEGGEWHEGRGDPGPWGPGETKVPSERTDSRLAGQDPEENVRL